MQNFLISHSQTVLLKKNSAWLCSDFCLVCNLRTTLVGVAWSGGGGGGGVGSDSGHLSEED